MKRCGLTLEEWLKDAPEAFKKWERAYGHWDQGNPVGWAVYCWLKERDRREARHQ